MSMETKVGGDVIYNGKILRLDRDEVALSDGSHSYREIVRHNGGAGVLFVRDGKILLVKQFRYAYGRELYEIPAGKLDGAEDPARAALRELKEETGFLATQAKLLAKIFPSPGYTDEIIWVYLVDEACEGEAQPDLGEFVQGEWFYIEDVARMIACGEICDAKTVIAFLRYQQGLLD